MANFLKPSANVPPIDGGQPFSRPWYDFFSKLATLGNLADVSAELTLIQTQITNLLNQIAALDQDMIFSPAVLPAQDEMIFSPVQYFAAPTVTLPSYGEDSTVGATITGAVNGLNTAFVLAHAPNPASSLALFYNGQRWFAPADFTLSGANITTVLAPPTGDRVDASYRY